MPCLFDVEADISEYHDLSATHTALRTRLWGQLNHSNLELYMHRANTKNSTTDPTANRSPARLVGLCNTSCAVAYWSKFGLTDEGKDANDAIGAIGQPQANAPICGVPGCS